MRTYFTYPLCTILVTVFSIAAIAQIPANDNCSGAILITTTPFGPSCSSSTSANTAGATQSLPNPSCTGTLNDDDIWYRFVANSSSIIFRYTNAVIAGTAQQATVGYALYSSSCPANTSTIACSNANVSGAAQNIIDGLTTGTTYYLRLWSFNTGTAITFDFCVQDVPAAPANDECNSATSITTRADDTACAFMYNASTIGATRSSPNPTCGAAGANDDIWYVFKVSNDSIRIRFANAVLATGTTNANLGYALYRDSCSSPAFSCSGNIGSGSGLVTIGGLTPGADYYLRFFSLFDDNYMTFDFCVQSIVANDECNNAALINTVSFDSVCSASISASTSGANASSPKPTCASTLDKDIWYKFVANSQSIIFRYGNIANEAGRPSQLGVALYGAGCPGTSTELACAEFQGNGHRIIAGLTIGNTYYLRLWTNEPGSVSFNFCVQDVPPPPANDECNNAFSIVLQPDGSTCNVPTAATTVGATRSVLTAGSCNDNGSNDDIWYSFVATSPAVRLRFSNAVLATSNGSAVLGYALYNDSCLVSTASLSCDNNIGQDSGSVLIPGLIAGKTYLLRLYSNGLNDYMNFDFCLRAAVQAPLPLQFVAVSGLRRQLDNHIKWIVVKDDEIDHFQIHRSENGSRFETIHLKSANNFVNDNNSRLEYLFIDKNAPDKQLYYRIIIVGKQSNKQYSPIISINKTGAQTHTAAFPNPVSKQLNISLNDHQQIEKLVLFSVEGKLIKQMRISFSLPAIVSMNVENLPAGLYILHVKDDKGSTKQIIKVVKQ